MPVASPPRPAAVPRDIRLTKLFLGCLQVSLSGFGGVLAWTHRVFVEKLHWLDNEDFTEMLSFCQFMPGPNIVIFAVCLGQRFRGLTGAIVAVAGVLLVPLMIFIGLGALYTHFGEVPAIHRMLGGVSAAAAGMIISMGAKMVQAQRKRAWSIGIGIAAFVSVGLMQWPLLTVLLFLVPPSIALAWATRAWLPLR